MDTKSSKKDPTAPPIPNVAFDITRELDIEVLDFELLSKRFKKADHDPFAVHVITFYLILVVTDSEYTHFLDFHNYKLRAGSVLFVAKNQIQRFSQDIEKASGYAIVFNSEFLNQHYFLSNKLKLNRVFNYHIESPLINQGEWHTNDFIDISQKLYNEYNASSIFAKSEILGSLLNVFLLHAERTKELKSDVQISPHWMDLFGKFKSLLEQEYAHTRNSREYASMLNISYKLLNEVVKKLSGKTAKSFIDTYVTIEIKRYLATTPLSVKEISHKTGFAEPANMVKFFKKNTSLTPLGFRNR